MLLLLLACSTGSFEPCGDGLGRADDGKCYLLADSSADTGFTTTETSTSTQTDTGTGVGTPITVEGLFTITSTVQSGANCAVSAWEASALLADGRPDHFKQALSTFSLICPTDSTPTSYSASLTVGNGTTSIGIVGFVDPDGTPDTPNDTIEVGSPSNPFDATPGLTYTGVDLTL